MSAFCETRGATEEGLFRVGLLGWRAEPVHTPVDWVCTTGVSLISGVLEREVCDPTETVRLPAAEVRGLWKALDTVRYKWLC